MLLVAGGWSLVVGCWSPLTGLASPVVWLLLTLKTWSSILAIWERVGLSVDHIL